MRTRHRGFRRFISGLLAAAIGVPLGAAIGIASGVASPSVESAAAADLSLFNPGLIITDSLFYDANAMSTADIQAFLNAKIGSCGNGLCLNVLTVTYPGRAQEVSTTTGNLICSAIPGGTMSAAELIYRAQVGCGISAKVLLVTLQKEQGLVTSRSPSALALQRALGMACPDTAPCDSAYSGFATQVVEGARQLKAYEAARFGKQPGSQYLQWHPNAACGGSVVNVANYATAALYNYTPYQPNAAALANQYGTGDSCSSYGNRNFFSYYNDWFGPSWIGAGQQALNSAFALAGGVAVFGAGVSGLDCPENSVSCWPRYQSGSIYWSVISGATVVLGAKDTLYRSIGGPQGALGYPISGLYTYSGNGGGTAQDFQGGSIFESPVGAFALIGAMQRAYFDQDGSTGWMGWPTAAQTCVGSSCWQTFQNGAIYLAGAARYVLHAAEQAAYLASGGPDGPLGYPISDSFTYTANGGGVARDYVGGSIFVANGGAGFAVSGQMRSAYFATGGSNGSLGWPTTAQSCIASTCWQVFQNGALYLASGVVRSVAGAIEVAHAASGGPTGSLGLPVSGVYTYAQNGGGTAQDFAGGSIYASSAGAFPIVDPIRRKYFDQGGSAGALGWPIDVQQCAADNVCKQDFQTGTITAALPTTTQRYTDALGSVASAQRLGSPTTQVFVYPDNGGGVAQDFGSATSVYASAAGAFVVAGSIRRAYFDRGGAAGWLGWPVGAEGCGLVSGGCVQPFQYGSIYRAGVSVQVMNAAIAAAWIVAGGASGPLGTPISGVYTYTKNGGGTAQDFQGGSIFSAAGGAFPVAGSIRRAYFDQGGSDGTLGWPTSIQSCDSTQSMCKQTFQFGAIYLFGGVAYAIPTPIDTAWSSAGGASGSLGQPISKTYMYPDNGGGMAQDFQAGSIYASTSGAFPVIGAVRRAYFDTGGSAGALGWPTAGLTCDANGCSQAFQAGMIYQNAALAYAISGAELAAYVGAGGPGGMLGLPASSLYSYPANGGGTARDYVGGSIYSSSAGAFVLSGGIRRGYFDTGGATGDMGWPITARACLGGACFQRFQYGSIYNVTATGENFVLGKAEDLAYTAVGREAGILGYPNSQLYRYVENGGGTARDYVGGSIYASAAGAFAVTGNVRRAYFDQGGASGRLGWPTGSMVCASGSCTQTFQNGSVTAAAG